MFKDIFIHIHKKLFITVIFSTFSLAIHTNAHASEIPVGSPVAPPVGYLRFCLMNIADCRATQDALEPVSLNSWHWAELKAVQTLVNRQVQPRSDEETTGKSADMWEYPKSGYGDCEDYALAKRQALIARGWPSKALRLVTARTRDNQPHVVLAVSTSDGDFILDNRFQAPQHWEAVDYRWISIQDRENPLRWHAARSAETAIASLDTGAAAQQ